MKKAPKIKRKKYVTGGQVDMSGLTPEQQTKYNSYNNPDQAYSYYQSVVNANKGQTANTTQDTSKGNSSAYMAAATGVATGLNKAADEKYGDYRTDSEKQADATGASVTGAIGTVLPWVPAVYQAGSAASKTVAGDRSDQTANTAGTFLDPTNQFSNNENAEDWIVSFANPVGSALDKEKRTREGASKEKDANTQKRVSAMSGQLAATEGARMNQGGPVMADEMEIPEKKQKNPGFMSAGGKVVGPGTGKSDSVKGNLAEGSFVATAENKKTAQAIGEKYLGWKAQKVAALAGGGNVPVAVSNGEVVFTPAEVAKLTKMGVNLDKLAPNAASSQKLKDGGYAEFKKKMGQSENSGKTTGTNQIGAIGKYQFMPDTLKQLGYSDKDIQKFESDPKMQEEAMDKLIAANEKSITDNGWDKLIGKKIGDVTITKTGLLGALHLGGVGSVKKWIDSGGRGDAYDANGTKISDYAKKFEKAEDVSAKPQVKPELTNKEVTQFSKMLMDQNISDNHFSAKPVNGKLLGQLNEYDKQRVRHAYLEDLKGMVSYKQKSFPNGTVTTSEPHDPTLKPVDLKKHAAFINQIIPAKDYKDISPFKEDKSKPAVNPKAFGSDDEERPGEAIPTITEPAEVPTIKGGRFSGEVTNADGTPVTGVPDKLEARTPEEAAAKASAPSGERNLLDKVGGPAALAAIGQFGLGMYQDIKAGKRPKDKIDGAILSQLGDAMNDRGWDPAVEAAANDRIELNRRADVLNINNMSGGDTGTALANATAASNTANRAIVDLAKEKEGIRMAKAQRADQLATTVAGMKRNIFQDDLSAFHDNQKASGDLIQAGISNYIGAMQNREDQAREDERLAKYRVTKVA